jgi:hypothetical protein
MEGLCNVAIHAPILVLVERKAPPGLKAISLAACKKAFPPWDDKRGAVCRREQRTLQGERNGGTEKEEEREREKSQVRERHGDEDGE